MPDNVLVRSKRNWLAPYPGETNRLPVVDGYKYRHGNAYNHGMLPPHYPVPTTIRIDDKWKPAQYVIQWHWVTFRLGMGWGIDG